MLTFDEFKTEARNRAKDKASICSDTIMKRWARLIVFDLVIRSGGFWLYDEYTFSSVDETAEYAFPSRFLKPTILFDTTNENKITKCGPDDDHLNIDRDDTGTPNYYKYTYLRSVQNQPSTASKLSFSSSSASDINVYYIQIRGLDANNVEISEQITLNGATAVESAETYTTILEITKSGSCNGIVTVTSNSAAVTILKLGKDELRRQHQWIRLIDTPNAAIDYRLNFLRKPHLCIESYDVFDVPEVLENAMMLGLEYFVKKYLYDKTDDKVLAAYIDQVKVASRFLDKTYDERFIHMPIGEGGGRGNTQYTAPRGWISQRSD